MAYIVVVPYRYGICSLGPCRYRTYGYDPISDGLEKDASHDGRGASTPDIQFWPVYNYGPVMAFAVQVHLLVAHVVSAWRNGRRASTPAVLVSMWHQWFITSFRLSANDS